MRAPWLVASRQWFPVAIGLLAVAGAQGGCGRDSEPDPEITRKALAVASLDPPIARDRMAIDPLEIDGHLSLPESQLGSRTPNSASGGAAVLNGRKGAWSIDTRSGSAELTWSMPARKRW